MRFILVFGLLISLNGFSQWKDYVIGVKGDTLNRVDKSGKKQGPWVLHYDEMRGEKGYEEEGFFVDDKKEGPWRRYSLMGDKLADENYRWGNKDGKCTYYTNMGGLLREESWKAVNPENPYDTVDVYDMKDPTKVNKRVIVKVDGFTLKHGTWTYYDPMEGTIVKTERYWHDKLNGDPNGSLAKGGTDDDLQPIDISTGKNSTDSTGKKKVSKPQVVVDYEKKNANKKKIKVRDGQTGY